MNDNDRIKVYKEIIDTFIDRELVGRSIGEVVDILRDEIGMSDEMLKEFSFDV